MASISLDLVPFEVPDRVTVKMPAGRRQDGIQPSPQIPLEELEVDVAEALLAEFCEAVMAKVKGE